MIWTPHVTVAAVVARDGRFLMVEERIDDRLRLNQPAGHLEEGESLLQAVVRETREETGHTFVPEGLVGVYRWFNVPSGVTYLRFCFAGSCGERDESSPLDEGIVGPVWLSWDELQHQKSRLRSPLVLACIDDFRHGRRFPLDLITDLG